MQVFYGLLASNTAVTLPDLLHDALGRPNDDLATCRQPASTIAKGIVCKTGPGVHVQRHRQDVGRRRAGHPGRVFSKAPENQLIITANLFADYDVVRPAGYLQVEFKTFVALGIGTAGRLQHGG